MYGLNILHHGDKKSLWFLSSIPRRKFLVSFSSIKPQFVLDSHCSFCEVAVFGKRKRLKWSLINDSHDPPGSHDMKDGATDDHIIHQPRSRRRNAFRCIWKSTVFKSLASIRIEVASLRTVPVRRFGRVGGGWGSQLMQLWTSYNQGT